VIFGSGRLDHCLTFSSILVFVGSVYLDFVVVTRVYLIHNGLVQN
jgi:hypothetical protein